MFEAPDIRYRARQFFMSSPDERQELERIKQEAVVLKNEGWAIKVQKESFDKFGSVSVYLEWTEPV